MLVRQIVLGCLVATVTASSLSAQVTQTWAAFYDSGGFDKAADVGIGPGGEIYVTGHNSGIVTVRYDDLGTVVWKATYSVGSCHQAVGLATTPDGGVAVAGMSCLNSMDFAVVRYDRLGTEMWRARLDGPAGGFDEAADIAVDDIGNVYVVGTTSGHRSRRLTVVKYDPAGTELWVRHYDGGVRNDARGLAVAVSDDGHVAVVGSTELGSWVTACLTLEYDPGGTLLWAMREVPFAVPHTYRLGSAEDVAFTPTGDVVMVGSLDQGHGQDIAVVCYDANGGRRWLHRYNGPLNAGSEYGKAIAVDSKGDVYATGSSAYVYNANGTHYYGMALLKISNSGVLQWVRRKDGAPTGSVDVLPEKLALDSAGNAYVVGTARPPAVPLMPVAEIFALRYDTVGNATWETYYSMPSPCNESNTSAQGVAVDPSGPVYVCGSAEGTQNCPKDMDLITLRLDQGCGVPETYCTAKTSSTGCAPAIAISGTPSASTGSGCLLVTTSLTEGRPGLYMHSTSGAWAQPFHGGWQCLQSPITNHAATSVGGRPATCGGVLSEDLNAYIASGADPALVAGVDLWLQAWSRDPGDPFGDSLSDALHVVICP